MNTKVVDGWMCCTYKLSCWDFKCTACNNMPYKICPTKISIWIMFPIIKHFRNLDSSSKSWEVHTVPERDLIPQMANKKAWLLCHKRAQIRALLVKIRFVCELQQTLHSASHSWVGGFCFGGGGGARHCNNKRGVGKISHHFFLIAQVFK